MTATRIAEFTGGSMDGAVYQLPARVGAAVTARRDGGQSHYILDDDTGGFVFVGFNDLGASMAGIVRQSSDAAHLDAEAIEQAAELVMRPRGCASCGGTYGSGAAYTVHFEQGPGSRCLPGDARGQLLEVDGVWMTPAAASRHGRSGL